MKVVKIVTIIGARPQIIKAAALSRAIRLKFSDEINEVIVHTGQHYDENMSQVFFDELEIPRPHYNLQVGSASHGVQTARMIEGIEQILMVEKPDFIVLYGDTNSTLAGAVSASKMHIPVAHIEAGLRSFNKSMPEEINRILCDHCSTLLFSPTKTGYNNLLNEGFKSDNLAPYNADNPAVYHCGDVMYDNSLYFGRLSDSKCCFLKENNLDPNRFILCTIHRDNNTDQPERLNSIFRALLEISRQSNQKIFIPLHPRTSKLLAKNLQTEVHAALMSSASIVIAPPASFIEMIQLEKNASVIITDSGGVQKEAYFFDKPCIILRPETEWKEIVEAGTAIIADAEEAAIIAAWKHFFEFPPKNFPKIFGDGNAAEFIIAEIIKNANSIQ
jgi:UDP-GlcNAc3NAcA epimerase